MLKSKTLNLLRELSAWERRHLWEYISSPFFNKNEKVTQFCEHIFQFAPDFDHPSLKMEALFPHFYPSEEYNHQKLRYLMSDFTKLLEGYLAYQQWQQDEIGKDLYLLKACADLKQNKVFEEKNRKIKQKLQKSYTQSHDGYADRLRYLEISYRSSIKLGIKNTQTYQVSDVVNALDELFLVNKLRYSCELVNQSKVRNRPFDFFLTEELVQKMEEGPKMGGVLGKLYYQALLTLQSKEDHKPYFQFKEMLNELESEVNNRELSDLYICALNYSINQINKNENQFHIEVFEVYKTLIEKKLIMDENGRLPLQNYKNMVTVGTRVKEYDWTETFIESYKKYLSPKEAENAYTYNMAWLQTEMGNFKQVKRLLAFVEFPNVFYQLGSRLMLIKTYYELEDFDDLTYLLNSFRMFLRRNKVITEERRKSYLNLIHVLNHLLRYHHGGKTTLTELTALFKTYPDVAAYTWLEEKIGELTG